MHTGFLNKPRASSANPLVGSPNKTRAGPQLPNHRCPEQTFGLRLRTTSRRPEPTPSLHWQSARTPNKTPDLPLPKSSGWCSEQTPGLLSCQPAVTSSPHVSRVPTYPPPHPPTRPPKHRLPLRPGRRPRCGKNRRIRAPRTTTGAGLGGSGRSLRRKGRQTHTRPHTSLFFFLSFFLPNRHFVLFLSRRHRLLSHYFFIDCALLHFLVLEPHLLLAKVSSRWFLQ